MKRFLAIAATALLMNVSLANAQAPTPLCTPGVSPTSGQPTCVPVNAANPLPISGSFSATLTGFLSNNVFATLTATGSTSASTALPAGATSVRITNNGTTVVSCTMATGAATGLVSNILVQSGSSVSRVVGTFDHIACIDQTGSVSNPVVIEGGSGLGNDSSGGSGGGGGSVTQGTVPWVTSPGILSPTLTAWSTGVNTTQTLMPSGGWPAFILSLKESSGVTAGAIIIEGTYDGTFTDNAGAAFPILPSQLMNAALQCSSVSLPFSLITVPAVTPQLLIFTQGFAQVRTRVTSNVTGGTVTPTVQLLSLLPYDPSICGSIGAGSNIIGRVGIDQTTPGTTNGISIAADSGTVTGLTPVIAGTSATNVVAKASAGNLLNAYVTSSAAGWIFLINAASLPGNATLTVGTASGNLQGCFELQKGVTDWQGSINYNPGPWEQFSTGIVVAISSTDCPVLTAASTGKYIHATAK